MRWKIFGVVVFIGISIFLLQYANVFGLSSILVVNQNGRWGKEKEPTIEPNAIPITRDPEYAMPDNDSSRIDILILGIRGEGDTENGGLLTDTILLFSLNPTTGASALTSIPRDLEVRTTDARKEKINAAYERLGPKKTKELYSRITGISIDQIVIADFVAFKDVVNTLGGVTIILDKPFKETKQWGFDFSLPAGTQTLTGDQALLYVRSRYGSSDFDRSRRQMQVISAMRAQAEVINLTHDPIKVLEILTTLKKHIVSDLNIFDIGTIKNLAGQLDNVASLKRYQLTPENILDENIASGSYSLTPRGGSLQSIKTFFRSVLSPSPVLPRAPASPSGGPTPSL